MRITETQLRQIIREEVREGARALRKALREAPRSGDPDLAVAREMLNKVMGGTPSPEFTRLARLSPTMLEHLLGKILELTSGNLADEEVDLIAAELKLSEDEVVHLFSVVIPVLPRRFPAKYRAAGRLALAAAGSEDPEVILRTADYLKRFIR